MKKYLIMGFLFVLLSCDKTLVEIEKPAKSTTPPNSTEVNLAIGIQKDADLNFVLNTINGLNFDIRQMNGFVYNANTPANQVANLIEFLNQKPYINTGPWRATPYSVFFYPTLNKTRITNGFFEMNVANQTDLLNLITSLNLEDAQFETKNMYLSVPVGSHGYWKEQMKTYPFVKWTETFDQVCVSYSHSNIVSVNVPINGNINQNIIIPITFEVGNGCGGFGSISESNTGNTKTIKINAKYEGCYCTQALGIIQTNYNFVASTSGIYTIRFAQPGGGFLTKTINIQ